MRKYLAKRILITILIFFFTLILFLFCFISDKLSKLSRLSTTETTVISCEANPIEEKEDFSTNKEMQDAMNGLEEKKAIAATGDIFSNTNVFNLLLIGTDERSTEFNTNARGDACMILSINKENRKVHLISFERGMGVPILDGVYKGQYDWLTHCFRYGGADLMMREIQECFKLEVSNYIRVNFQSFIEGINEIGGIDITLTQKEAEYINSKRKETENVQEVTAGENHLNGETALVYARCRKIDDDWSRIGRQRTVIQATLNEIRDLSVFELNDLLDQILPLIQTNMSNGEMFSLLFAAPQFVGQQLIQETIPLEGTYGSMTGMDGRSMYDVDFETNAKYLKEMLYGASK